MAVTGKRSLLMLFVLACAIGMVSVSACPGLAADQLSWSAPVSIDPQPTPGSDIIKVHITAKARRRLGRFPSVTLTATTTAK